MTKNINPVEKPINIHKQQEHARKWFSKKKLLLFVLFFSLVLLGMALFQITTKNKWIYKEFEKQEAFNTQKETFERLGFLIKAAESAKRRFALTGNKLFIQNFNLTADSLQVIGGQLQAFAGSEAEATHKLQLQNLATQLQQKLAFMRQVIALSEVNSQAASTLIAAGEGLRLSDSITVICSNIIERYKVQLQSSKSAFGLAKSSITTIAYSCITLSLLLIILGFTLLFREIRRTKKVLNELHLQKGQYQATINSISEGLISTGKNGQVLFMNPAAEKITGWKNAEAKNLPLDDVYDVLDEETGKPFKHIVKRILEEGKSIEMENHTILKTKDSTALVISNTGSPLYDMDGVLTGAVLVFNDVTEKKIFENRIKENEEKYRLLFEEASDGIIICSFDGTVCELNHAVYKILGYKKEEFEKLNFQEILINEIVASPANLQRVKDGETVLTITTFKKKSGMLQEVEINSKLQPDGHIISFLRDVTARKLIDEDLKESEAKYRSFFENSMDGILLTVKDGSVLAANKAACDIFNMTEAEVCAAGRAGLVDTTDPRLTLLLQEREETGKAKAEITVKRKDGTMFPGEVSSAVFKDAHGMEKISMVIRDISDRHLREQRIRLSELRLNEAQAIASIGSWETNLQTLEVIWSEETFRIFGISPADFKPTHEGFLKVIHADDRARVNSALQHSTDIDKAYSIEHRVVLANQNDKIVQERWQIFTNDQGVPTRAVGTCQDITERKMAEHKFNTASIELANAVADLNKILDSSLDVICTINTKGEFVNVSAASQQVWGYKAEELIGTKFMKLVYPEDIERTSKAAENITKNIPVPIFENRYVHKSGRIVPILWSVNWDEKLQLMFCIAKDVTEKKILEKAVETERDQFFDMFSKAPSAIGMLKGPDHIFEVANPLYLQLTGKKDIIGKTVAEVLPEVIEQGFISMLDNVYRTGETYIGTETLVRVDKEGNGELADFYMNFIYQAYRNGKGEIEGVFFFINDITEQILSRKEIEKSEKFFKGVIESSADMVTIIDSSGKTVYASPAVSKKFGYTNEECLEINVADIVHPDDAQVMQEFITKIMMNPGVPMDCPLIRDRKKDGSYFWVEGTITNFLEAEGINAIVANFRDITERKNAEKELQESEFFNRSILTSMSSHIAVVDEEGKIMSVNKAWSDFSINNGASSLERTGQGSNYFEACRQAALGGDKTAAEALAGIKKVLRKEIPFFEIEYPCHSPSEHRWFLLRVTNFIGNIPKVVTVHTDITARKLSEMQRQIALERYDTLAKATSDTIWDLDILNNKMQYNDGITKMMGYQKREVKDVTDWWKQHIHPDDLGIVTATLDKIFETREQSFQMEYRFHCADGSYKDIFDRAFVIYDEHGQPTRMIGAMRDVTHEREEDLRVLKAIVETQETERKQLGMELHDNVNQLLSASLLYLGLANERQKNGRDISEMIDSCKINIMNAIDETRKLSHQLAPASNADLSMKDMFEVLILSMNPNNRFLVNFHFDDFESSMIGQGLQIALYRILQEQLNNILKYAQAKMVDVSVTFSDGLIKLRIADDGKGFDTNAVKIGIGLGNIKRRTEMYAGKFTCTSSTGNGCEVVVAIPLVGS